jgi:predicted RND superfamily exporter protein
LGTFLLSPFIGTMAWFSFGIHVVLGIILWLVTTWLLVMSVCHFIEALYWSGRLTEEQNHKYRLNLRA